MKTKEVKREESKKRQEEYDKLTLQQKIEKLDKKFGVGQGAKRQRERLQKQIENEQNKQETEKIKKQEKEEKSIKEKKIRKKKKEK